jgi:hypothetical protein
MLNVVLLNVMVTISICASYGDSHSGQIVWKIDENLINVLNVAMPFCLIDKIGNFLWQKLWPNYSYFLPRIFKMSNISLNIVLYIIPPSSLSLSLSVAMCINLK